MDNPQHQDRKTPNALSYLFGKTWRYSQGNRKSVVAYWLLFITGNAITLFCEPLLWASFMNRIQTEGVSWENFPLLIGTLALIVGLGLTFWAFHGPGRLIERANAFRVRAAYRKYLLQGVVTLGLDWHQNHHSGDTIDRIEKGATAMQDFSAESFEVISPIVRLIVSCGMLVWFSPSSIVVVAIMLVATTWLTVRFDKVLIPQYQRLNRADNQIAERVFDTISNITTVVILRIERLVFEAISSRIDQPYDLYKQNNRVSELKWFMTSILSHLMTALVIGIYCWQHMGATQGILIGNLYILLKYLGEITDLFFKFTGSYAGIIKYKAKVMNAEDLAEEFIPGSFTNHVLPAQWQEVRVSGLSFSYSSSEQAPLHLDNIGFSLFRGEKIGVVGRSGDGKSTFLKLLRDLYHPRSLELGVDGVAIPHGFDGISRAISLIPQDPEIFATTILENITLGAEYPQEEVDRFVGMACFADVVEALPHGLLSSIKEKGVSLSGGQRQRLALARGLLASRDKSIVLLDEPTSSMDVENERKIYQNIFEAFPDKAVLSSIHRLNLLPLFDRIFFFEGGRLTTGTLDELIAGNASFRILWDNQQGEALS